MAANRLGFDECFFQKGEKRGEVKGIVITMNSLGKTREETCDILKEKCGLGHEEASHEIDGITGLEWPEATVNAKG